MALMEIADEAAERRILGRLLKGNPYLVEIAEIVASRLRKPVNEVISDFKCMIGEAEEATTTLSDDVKVVKDCAILREIFGISNKGMQV